MSGTLAEPSAWREQVRDVAERLLQPNESLRLLLHDLVERAVRAVGSNAGSILIPDAAGRQLRFFVSHGPKAEQITQLLVPIDGSIAGHVFSTGQMMAMSDLQEERAVNFYDAIDKTLGLATRTYLALPVLAQGRALGVATFVNRPGEPPFRPFDLDEMAAAQRFAAVEAVALQTWQRTRQLADLAAHDFAALFDEPAAIPRAEIINLRDPWASVLHSIHHLSEHDQTLCAELIAVVARHAQGIAG
jgi:signal transduction protein with GAF and PtsI domain